MVTRSNACWYNVLWIYSVICLIKIHVVIYICLRDYAKMQKITKLKMSHFCNLAKEQRKHVFLFHLKLLTEQLSPCQRELTLSLRAKVKGQNTDISFFPVYYIDIVLDKFFVGMNGEERCHLSSGPICTKFNKMLQM